MKRILSLLHQLSDLRRAIEYKMLALPERFQRTATDGLLRLRAWHRRKDGPPYAVYWIIFNRRRIAEHRWQRSKPTFPFRRPRIRTRRNLDDAIFFARASKVRRVVYRFHALVKVLNSTHASISRVVESLRKRLHPFRNWVTEEEGELHIWHGNDFGRIADLLRGFELAFDEARTALQRLALDMFLLPGIPARLVYDLDFEHRHGRLRWVDVRNGRPLPPLTQVFMRFLRFSPDVSRLLAPYEQARRRAMRRMTSLTRLPQHLRAPLPHLLRKTLELLRSHGIKISLEEEAA